MPDQTTGSPMSSLQLLLAHADDGTAVLDEGLPLEAARSAPPPDDGRKDTPMRGDTSADPNDLAAQGWGLVVPEGPMGQRLLEALDPLVRWRAELQGRPCPIYRVPSQMGSREALRWRREVYAPLSVADSDRPFYLLFLGDFHQVPLCVQQLLPPECIAGRLALQRPEDYEVYAQKVVGRERRSASPPPASPRLICYTAHDGTRATSDGYEALVKPGVALARKELASGRLKAGQVVEVGDLDFMTSDELVETAGVTDGELLFSLCHGAGAPRDGWPSYDEQRRRQGAMTFGSAGMVGADDLVGLPFMEGGVWFHLSCFGAGTPGQSAYYHWLKHLLEHENVGFEAEAVLRSMPPAGSPGFVAALPQAVLASERGPLAFIGHLDLAWSYSFQDAEGNSRATRFLAIWQALVAGRRAGVALSRLTRDFLEANFDLTNDYDSEREARSWGRPVTPDPARRAHLWLQRQDLGGFLLLGDPAVCLGAQAHSAAPAAVPTVIWPEPGPPPIKAGPVSFVPSSSVSGVAPWSPAAEGASSPAPWEQAIAERIAAGAVVSIQEEYSGAGEDHALVKRTICIE